MTLGQNPSEKAPSRLVSPPRGLEISPRLRTSKQMQVRREKVYGVQCLLGKRVPRGGCVTDLVGSFQKH